jgi:hypothetical protein
MLSGKEIGEIMTRSLFAMVAVGMFIGSPLHVWAEKRAGRTFSASSSQRTPRDTPCIIKLRPEKRAIHLRLQKQTSMGGEVDALDPIASGTKVESANASGPTRIDLTKQANVTWRGRDGMGSVGTYKRVLTTRSGAEIKLIVPGGGGLPRNVDTGLQLIDCRRLAEVTGVKRLSTGEREATVKITGRWPYERNIDLLLSTATNIRGRSVEAYRVSCTIPATK